MGGASVVVVDGGTVTVVVGVWVSVRVGACVCVKVGVGVGILSSPTPARFGKSCTSTPSSATFMKS